MDNWSHLVRLLTFTYEFSLTSEPTMNFNVVFWSLSTEVQFYIFVPFIFSYFKQKIFRPQQVYLAGIFICLSILFIRCLLWMAFKTQITEQFSYVVKYWYTPLIMNLDLFLCGFLVNIYLKHQHFSHSDRKINFLFNRLNKKYIALILFVLLYLFTAFHLYHYELSNSPAIAGKGIRTGTTFFLLQPLTALITSFFIWAFESDIYHDLSKNEKLSFTAILKNPFRVLEILGNLSYGIYIWHKPILEKLTPVFTSKIPIEAFYLRFTATVILSTLLATATYYLVEIPYSQRKTYREKSPVTSHESE